MKTVAFVWIVKFTYIGIFGACAGFFFFSLNTHIVMAGIITLGSEEGKGLGNGFDPGLLNQLAHLSSTSGSSFLTD